MGAWTDVAAWAGPIPNCGPGRMSAHVGVVIHTAEGSYAGTDSWQRNPAAEVGSHFLTAKDGRVEQLIDTDIRSWCQSAGNDAWISVENEGFGSRGDSLSPGQVEANARILAKAHQVYGVPLQVSNDPGTPGLGWHGMGGTAWGGHFDCPGNAIKAQLPAIVARAAQILNGGNDVSQGTDNIVAAWAGGMEHGAGGEVVAPVTWRIRDEKWQTSVNQALTALSQKIATPAPVAMTSADQQAIANLVIAALRPLLPTVDQVAAAVVAGEAKALAKGTG